jgi:hypothetical protein
MKQIGLAAALAAVVFSVPALAQQADPLTAALKRQFDGIALNLKEAAEAMPDAKYSFKPSPDVKTFGAEVGHGANAQFNFCARAKGEPNPNKEDFEKVTDRAALIKAIVASNEYCASVFGGANDKWLMEMVGQGPQAQPRAAILAANIAHSNETYGTMVPYMRMSGVVPPSTARAQRR